MRQNNTTRSLACLSLLALSAVPAQAVFSFGGLQVSNGILEGATWTGDGVLPSGNLLPGTSTDSSPGNSGTLFDNFSGSGTLTPTNLITGNRLEAGASASVQFTLNGAGATGDLVVNNNSRFDGGANSFNSLGLTDLTGVTSIDVTVTYSQFVGGRDFPAFATEFNKTPMIAATRLVTPGTGFTASDFTVTGTLDEVFTSADGTNFVAGSAGITPTVTVPPFTAPSAGAVSATANSFDPGNAATWLMFKGFDVDGDGAFDADDADNAYARSVTYTITPTAQSTFADDTLIVFSLDGQSYGNLSNVPEPSAALLSVLALGALARRKRS